MNYSFTSESVSEGHPDKVADQISDAILDAYLEQDPDAKVACEVLITTQHCVIAGEVKTSAKHEKSAIDIAKETLEEIGYNSDASGFNHHTANFTYLLHEQSQEINNSVIDGGAGDQGLMFGYACKETESLMPLPITLSHVLVQRLAEFRKSGKIQWLQPDAKSQVTVKYLNNVPVAVERIVLSSQHLKDVTQEEIKEVLTRELILPTVEEYLPGSNPQLLINPSGSFTIGGPHGDTGLTGRKIIVDTYGGSCPHGGGAFSGKDPSKVDRSAAYAARYVAKHIVAAGLAERCTVQISYAIGKEEPTSLFIDLHGSKTTTEEQLIPKIREAFDLRPNGIIKQLGLKRPIYQPTAAYGHFGRNEFPWEQLDLSIVEFLTS
jgi:S-adenosylmethionine synthetase